MTLRCGCPAQGDETVIGPVHGCWPESKHAANLSAELRRLEQPVDECDGMDSPVDQLDLERRTNPYDFDDGERGGW